MQFGPPVDEKGALHSAKGSVSEETSQPCEGHHPAATCDDSADWTKRFRRARSLHVFNERLLQVPRSTQS